MKMFGNNKINKLIKNVKPEHRESVINYLVWQTKRAKFQKLLKAELFNRKDIEDYLKEVTLFKDFINTNLGIYKSQNIDIDEWGGIFKIDISYCENQLKLLNVIEDKNETKKK